jgi:hypothetical protein
VSAVRTVLDQLWSRDRGAFRRLAQRHQCAAHDARCSVKLARTYEEQLEPLLRDLRKVDLAGLLKSTIDLRGRDLPHTKEAMIEAVLDVFGEGHALPRKRARATRADNDQNTARAAHRHGQVLHRAGTWAYIRAGLDGVPDGAELVWITFSFAPHGGPRGPVEYLRQRKFATTVVCRHPRSRTSNAQAVQIAPRDWKRWTEVHGDSSLMGLQVVDGEDEEEVVFGALHAKAVVAKFAGGHLGIVGSFNLARNSLCTNTETAVRLSDGDARTLWEEAQELLRSSAVQPVALGDCSNEETEGLLRQATLARDVMVEGAPAAYVQDPARSRPPPAAVASGRLEAAARYTPQGLGHLKRAMDAMLSEWPAGSPSQGWQRATYQKLVAQMERNGSLADVLFLPVGLGKTFIALRWLLGQFEEADIRAGRRGIFLVPNEWIEHSVQADIRKVIARAVRDAEGAQTETMHVAAQCLAVVRPSALNRKDAPSRVVAVVADECHNWAPVADRSESGYSAHVERYRRSPRVRVLGLSATPCRMDHGKFSVTDFLREFRLPTYCRNAEPPLMSLASATAGKLLAPVEAEVLLPGGPQREIAKLLTSDKAQVAMGDYQDVILREVWGVLTRPVNETRMLDAIARSLGERSRRALVFMPPVGEAGDSFVGKLARRVAQLQGVFIDFRDRAEDDDSARERFELFRTARVSLGRPAVLVTVNRFSEGVSVNDVDTLIMLRATLSPRVATQALGRGLRLDPDRPDKVCRVLDAVGFLDRYQRWEALAP